MNAYYNELDPHAAQWLRELIQMKLIAPGEVDERSITQVQPDEVKGFTQCHFFAGVGVWSYALRQAGWPDDRAVWTGSCPCQPFSAAGSGKGVKDERHLWPAFHHLITACQPNVVLGEQVASADVIGKVKHVYAGEDSTAWLDLVQADLEAAHYTSGAIVTPSAGVGAPHIRQRTWWLAYYDDPGPQGRLKRGHSAYQRFAGQNSVVDRLGNASSAASERRARSVPGTQAETGGQGCIDGHDDHRHSDASKIVRVADTDQLEPSEERQQRSREQRGAGSYEGQGDKHQTADPCNGFWSDPDWLWCRDEKWRPVKPGLEPLVDGPASRVVSGSNTGPPSLEECQKTSEARAMRLKGYGNAINAESATVFIQCVMDVLPTQEHTP